MLYDPGLHHTYVCRSRVSQADGVAGTLLYRGYNIDELAERSTFLEVAFLLINGELPTAVSAGALSSTPCPGLTHPPKRFLRPG